MSPYLSTECPDVTLSVSTECPNELEVTTSTIKVPFAVERTLSFQLNNCYVSQCHTQKTLLSVVKRAKADFLPFCQLSLEENIHPKL